MICLSKADEGAFRHLEYNQSPRPLAAENTTRQDLNGIANLREHVAACQDGEGGCNGGCGGGSGGGGGGSGGMDEKMAHGGLPPGPSYSDAGRWPKEPSSCLSAVVPSNRLSALGALPLPSLSSSSSSSSPLFATLRGWASWLASVVAVAVLLNYVTSARSPAANVAANDGHGVSSSSPLRQLSRRASTCDSGGVSSDEYNTSLHAGALVIIWVVSSIACGFPILARRLPGLRIPQRFFFVVRHFGTGVLIATAFVHLFPTAFISLGDPCLGDFWVSDYPAIPGAIALAAIFLVAVIEMVFHPARRCTSMPGAGVVTEDPAPAAATAEKSSAGRLEDGVVQETTSATRDGGPKLTAPMRDMQPPRRRSNSMVHSLNRLNVIEASDDENDTSNNVSSLGKANNSNNDEAIADDDLELAPTQSPATSTPSLSPDQKLRKERLQCMLLELGILFHSIFIGMALSVSVGNEFVILLIAIVFHQTFEGLALGARIASIDWPQSNRRQPWLMALAYGCTTPLGQAIGIATHTLYSPGSEVGLVVVGVMNAISAGLLTFASLVELLSEDFLSDESWEYLRGRKRVVACLLVFLGAFCMSLVGAWA